MPMRSRSSALASPAIVALSLIVADAGSAGAQEPKAPAPAAKKAASPVAGPLGVLRAFNPLFVPLAICSVVALGYGLERFVALRRGRVIPREFVTRFRDRLASGKLDRERAIELCRANDSPMARVFGAVVRHWGQPAATIRQALGYDAGGEVSDLKRNVRVLNGAATIAPLLGLLGTVVGMIEAFDSFEAKGARPAGGGSIKGEALAHGISLALVSTAVGLLIAVVSATLYYYFLNKVDVLVRDLDAEAGSVIDLVSAEAMRAAPDRDRDRRPSPGTPDLARHGRPDSI